MTPTVVIIKNGVTESVTICKNQEDAEQLFVQENKNYGRETNSEELDNGFVELEDVTICLCWARTTNRN